MLFYSTQNLSKNYSLREAVLKDCLMTTGSSCRNIFHGYPKGFFQEPEVLLKKKNAILPGKEFSALQEFLLSKK